MLSDGKLNANILVCQLTNKTLVGVSIGDKDNHPLLKWDRNTDKSYSPNSFLNYVPN